MKHEIEVQVQRVKETLKAGKKLCLIQHDVNTFCDPYRRHVSLWIIHDGNEVYLLNELVEELGVASHFGNHLTQFSITSPDAFISHFLDGMIERFGLELPNYNGIDVDDYYRFIAA